MQTVLIVIHLMIVLALVVVVLLQRSEGGALGMGGGGGFMTGRGQANVLTRATAILAALFFVTSLGLTLLANYTHANKSILDLPATGPAQPAPATLPPKGQGSVLDQLRKIEQQRAGAPAAPNQTQTPGATLAPATPSAAPATAVPATAPTEPTGVPSKPADAVNGAKPAAPATTPAPATKQP